MPLIKINGLAYEFDTLDEEAKGHLRYLAFIDAELEQMAMRMNLLKISRDQIGQRLDAAFVLGGSYVTYVGEGWLGELLGVGF